MVENPHDKRFPVENRRRVGEPAVVKPREEPEIVDIFVVPGFIEMSASVKEKREPMPEQFPTAQVVYFVPSGMSRTVPVGSSNSSPS